MTTKKAAKRVANRAQASMRELEKLAGGPLTFGRLLQSIRLADEIDQAEMARKLGVTRQKLNDIEKGRRHVSLERAARLARELGYLEAQFVELALQDLLSGAGLRLRVTVEAA